MLNVVLTMSMKAEENQRPRLNWKRADWQSMKVELAAVNWEASMRSKKYRRNVGHVEI
jgi:hypothetical protein